MNQSNEHSAIKQLLIKLENAEREQRRAQIRKIVDNWPDWMKEVKLTKFS